MPNSHLNKQRNISEEEKRQNVYHLFFYLLNRSEYQFQPEYPFQSREQIEDFLSKVGLSMADLIQDGEHKFERDGRHFIGKHFKTSSNIGISKYEELGPDNNIQSLSYNVDLKSISATEMLDQSSKVFGHVGFTRTDLEETFKTACSEGILKPAIVFRNEARYEIADPRLEDFIFDYNIFFY